MSTAIHRYTPREYHLLHSQRDLNQRSLNSTSSTPRAASRTARPQSAHASSVTVQPVDHQRLNVQLLKEVEARNRATREEQKLSSVNARIANDALRAQFDPYRQQRRPSNTLMKELSATSPRRAQLVRDMSDVIATEEAHHREEQKINREVPASTAMQRKQHLPDYLLVRMDQQAHARAQQKQAQAVAESERSFPNGREPMNPDVAERTKEYLEMRVAELVEQLRTFSFRTECSVVGQRRKADLENQLRDTESALARFIFPVVFVRTSHPKPVIRRK